jgi:hypothetical protein
MSHTEFNCNLDQRSAMLSWQILYIKAKVEHQEQYRSVRLDCNLDH